MHLRRRIDGSNVCILSIQSGESDSPSGRSDNAARMLSALGSFFILGDSIDNLIEALRLDRRLSSPVSITLVLSSCQRFHRDSAVSIPSRIKYDTSVMARGS